nr:unnamed protein product [Callosobruchus chinensis]
MKRRLQKSLPINLRMLEKNLLQTPKEREIARGISKPLTYLFNLSVECGTFPESMKTAVVISIFKKGDKLNPKEYGVLWRNTILYKNISLVSRKVNLQMTLHRSTTNE